ncbi:hypothetical protein [Streptomyces cinereoruber]|uniref:hypothetical protein n=1 Tax=Streptomyces cinereoruber TaxID=67260 RepID=UPI00363F66A4
MNEHLRTTGLELRQIGTLGCYSRFTLVPLQLAHARAPKNVIFAVPAKPDIRFLSATDIGGSSASGRSVPGEMSRA